MITVETITPENLPAKRYQARCLSGDCEPSIRATSDSIEFVRGAAESHVEHFGHHVAIDDMQG